MLVQGSILVKMVYVYLIVQQVCAAAVTLDGGEIHAMWKHLQIHVTTISAEMVIAKDSPIRLTDVTAELVGLDNFVTPKFKAHAQTINVEMAIALGSQIQHTDVTVEMVGLGNSVTLQFKVLAQIISVKMAVDV